MGCCIFECILCCKTTLAVLAILIGWKIFMKYTTGICKSSKRLDGKTVIVTGANTGIGKEAALDFAQRRAKVILACRDINKANQARDEIVKRTGNENVIVRKLDLTSLGSVREFAKETIATEERLDILVNNAGISGSRKTTEDGLNMGMQVNHFGPFLLTNLLTDLMKKTPGGRIVFVSSKLHLWAKFELNNLNWENGGSSHQVYNCSKLANVINANELARRLKGTGLTVNSLHPGVVDTDIWRKLPAVVIKIIKSTVKHFIKSPYEGAQTTIYLAVSEEVEGVTGKYFADCHEATMSDLAKDEGLAKKFWEKSEEYVKLKK